MKPTKPLKSPPSVLQLPGGITVRGRDFRITAVDAHGRPTAFELARPGEDSDCVLWAADSFLGERLPEHLMSRYEKRKVAPPKAPLVNDERDIVLMSPENHAALMSRVAGSEREAKLLIGVDYGYKDEPVRSMTLEEAERVKTYEKNREVGKSTHGIEGEPKP